MHQISVMVDVYHCHVLFVDALRIGSHAITWCSCSSFNLKCPLRMVLRTKVPRSPNCYSDQSSNVERLETSRAVDEYISKSVDFHLLM